MLQYTVQLLASLRPLWSYVLNYVLALAILASILSVIRSLLTNPIER